MILKDRKLSETVQLVRIAVNNLKELAEALENEHSCLFRALEVDDAEKIEDATLYGCALDLEYNKKDIADKAEELESFLKDLEKVKL